MTDRQTPLWRVFALAAICLIVSGVSAAAETLYVDASNTTGVEDGTAAYPYSDINSAVLAAASGDTIRVAAGTYNEDVTIDSIAVRLLGEDPATTMIRGFNNVVLITGTFTSGADVVEIAGFTITMGATAGVYVNSGTAKASVHNCILSSNLNGVLINSGATANAYNNVIIGSSSAGLRANNSSRLSCSNNILLDNRYAVYSHAGSTVSCSNNTFTGNTTNCDCSKDFFKNCTSNYSCPSASNAFGEDCLFVDVSSSDLRLQPDSPCIDAGSSFPADNDPDGTRNDKGVYGGPGAAGFWPTPAGSPVVTELSVTPHDVPLGGTLTITAKGTAR